MENFIKNYKTCGNCLLMDTCPLGFEPVSQDCHLRIKVLIDTLIRFNEKGAKIDNDSLIERFFLYDFRGDEGAETND